MSNNLTFTINTVDKTANVLLDGFYIHNKRNTMPSAFFKIKDEHYVPNSTSTIFPVIISDTDTSANLFYGYLKNTDLRFRVPDIHIMDCVCAFDHEIQLLNTRTSRDFSSGTNTEKEILEDIMSGWSPDPITTHVIDGALTSIIWNDASPQRMLDDLANANDRYYYWDGDGELHYFANTGESAPFGLSDAPDNSTTYPYDKLEYSIDYLSDSVTNVYGGSLICWKYGLYPGMALPITNSHLSWSAESFIIDEVRMKYLGNPAGVVTWVFEVHFGKAKKRQVSDLIVRSNYTASTVSQGLTPPLENDTTKYYRSDGTFAAVSGVTPSAHASTHESGGSDVIDIDATLSSPTRVLDTIYQNTSGKAIFVAVSAYLDGNYSLVAQIGATSPPGTQVAYDYRNDGTYANSIMLYFIVPNNYYYRVQEPTATGTLNTWKEWSLN